MRAAALLIALALATPARADIAVPIPALIARPAEYVSKEIIIRKIRCIDPGASGFVCAGMDGRRGLRVEALLLGALTKLPIAEKLIGPCKGIKALEKPTCTFDITITPTSQHPDDGAGGPGSVTVLIVNEIEMQEPARIPRR